MSLNYLKPLRQKEMAVTYKSFVATLLLVCSLPLIFISRIEQYVSIGAYVQVFLGLLSYFVIFYNVKNDKRLIKFTILLFPIFLAIFFNLILIRNFELKQLLYAVIIMPAIALLLFFFKYPRFFTLIPFFVVLFITIYRWFVLGIEANEITVNSRNYIVYHLFLSSIPYILYCYRHNERPFVIIPIVFIAAALFAIGRGGIIMSIIFFIGWLAGRITISKHKYLIFFLILLFLITIIYLLISNDTVEVLFSRFEKNGFESSQRTSAWKQYIYSLADPFNFLFGTRVSTLPQVHELEDSLHNSYLNLHASMGLFCIPYLYLAISGFIVLLKKKEFWLAAFFGAFLIKGFVDADFPCSSVGGDIYMYLLMLIYIDNIYSKRLKLFNRHNESKTNSIISTSVSPDSGK